MSEQSGDPVLAEARPPGGIFAAVRDGVLLVGLCAVIGVVVGDLLPVLAIGVVGGLLISAGALRTRVRVGEGWLTYDVIGGSKRIDLGDLTRVRKLNIVGGARVEFRDSTGRRAAVPLSLLRRSDVRAVILRSLPPHGDASTTLRSLLTP